MNEEKNKSLSPESYPNEVASSKAARRKNRRIVRTPDGIFLIRRIRATHFVAGTQALEFPTSIDPTGKTPEQIDKEAELIAAQQSNNPKERERWLRFILEQGVVSEEIFKVEDGNGVTWSLDKIDESTPVKTSRIVLVEEDSDLKEFEISAYQLDAETLAVIMREVMNFCRFGDVAKLDTSLRNFRGGSDQSDRESEPEISSTPE